MIIWSKKLMSMAILAMLSTTSADVFAADAVHNGDGTEEEMPTYSLGDTIVTATRLRKEGCQCTCFDDGYYSTGD